MALADTTEFYSTAASSKLEPEIRSELGQYMTPAAIGRFMAGLFSDVSGDLRVLDPGAGVGSLTAAFVERLCDDPVKPVSVSLVCCEVAPELIGYLSQTLKESALQLEAARIPTNSSIHSADFLLSYSSGLQADLFPENRCDDEGFTHVIMNPPYRKIHSDSEHRAALRKAGIETSNLYTGFMFLAAQRLRNGGEMVAIVPRSFCNGPYFKSFRKQFFSLMGLQHIHVFEKRDSAFRSDGVLQENIIIHAIKGAKPAKVKITVSGGADYEMRPLSGEGSASDITERVMDYSSVIHPNDPDKFVHIITSTRDQGVADVMARLTATLSDVGLEVSTGPVVDFRAKPFLLSQPDGEAAPLLYPAHFRGSNLEWPKNMKKPNAIRVAEHSRKWLWANRGHFVVTKRFSAKEERRRIVASIYRADLPGELIGFENHLNVYHVNKSGFPPPLAAGLSIYLNSSLVDSYFRQFNGHTQVNATDLRALPYPERGVLERIGAKSYGQDFLSQQVIDAIIESELGL